MKKKGKKKNNGRPAGVLRIVTRHFPQVTKVEDATKNVTVEVTKQDESHSSKKDINGCAMAVACKRVFKADGVIMARSTAYLVKNDLAIRYKVPNSVSREITSFDRGAGFSPGVYQLSKIAASMRLDYKREHGSDGGRVANKGKTAGRYQHRTEGIRAILGSPEDKG